MEIYFYLKCDKFENKKKEKITFAGLVLAYNSINNGESNKK